MPPIAAAIGIAALRTDESSPTRHKNVTSSLIFLASLGSLAAYAGGASITVGALRVTFWGVLAMALTAAVGRLFGVVV